MNSSYNLSSNFFQQCEVSVMDNIADPYIHFDSNGISNYYHEFNNFVNQLQSKEERTF